MPTTITDQRVVAIYFDRNRRVERVASYGIKDGKIFDFVSRTTPTAGSDYNLLNNSCRRSRTAASDCRSDVRRRCHLTR